MHRWRIRRPSFPPGAAPPFVQAIAHAYPESFTCIALLLFSHRAVAGDNFRTDPFPRSLPDLMGLFVWILERVAPSKLAKQLDAGRHVVISTRATFPPWRKLRPEQTSGPVFQLGII